ncbi:MAG: recombination mediator RecR [Tenuifilaceae bacterium]|jgi:recombination protein RecR|uniref:recombination mediator RecR n=1 Tax=Perlabentimonas gracilis TaxID=2715279 RepID=UPI00140E21AA|nr:recombination mediator RecR [Perlabentimonas gracilis]MDX9769317.1 recombination mediator RecR [Tenuifilaceae bacterium]NHB69174.1 recombination protein RecR [Perlabentimonas gracilis]
MNIHSFPSKLLENAVDEFAKLPGIGRKTALRLVLHLLRQPNGDVERFSQAFTTLKNEIKHCRECNSISDTEVCSICSNPHRDSTTVCVVENIKDVMSIESTNQYTGLYYVLGAVINPMEGIGPADIKIDGLINKIRVGNVKEIIMALSPTLEGDTTNFYIFKKINQFPVAVSVIARGVAFGDDLEYADEITLGRAIVNRTKFESTIAN